MVGIVIVSHSAAIADGIVALAREMGGPDVALEPAGGLDEPDRPLGTDAIVVMKAIERADSGDGVLVLMDLGSAVLSAETALDLLPEDRRAGVALCEAPLVEGAVAAAVAARAGLSLDRVAGEARGGLAPKVEHLGGGGDVGAEDGRGGDPERGDGPAVEARIRVDTPHGLHARPAARFVRVASKFDARVEVTNVATGSGPAGASSFSALVTLGVRQGHEVLVRARGRQAAEAVAALEALAAGAFGDPTSAPGAPRTETATIPASPASPAGAARATDGETPQPQPALAAPAPGATLRGLPASPGAVVERVRRFAPAELRVPTAPAEDPEAEWAALERALEAARQVIEERLERTVRTAGAGEAAIFDAHLLLLEDEALLGPARRAILDDGTNAARAWSEAVAAGAASFREAADEYLRARGADVTDVGRTVLACLLGAEEAGLAHGDPCVLVAADLAPSETASLDPERVLAIVTARGALTSHSAILARSLGIVAVVGAGEAALAIPDGTRVAVDGDAGLVQVEPGEDLAAEYVRRRSVRDRSQREARARAHEPAITRDGRRIEVVANAATPSDAADAVSAGAEGIGLLRTELLFGARRSPPTELEIEIALREIAAALAGRPLIVRTLDAGADKPLPYLTQAAEDNPFLGLRGIRLTLAEPELMLRQLRAIVRVGADHPLKLMFPMVATLAELRRARELLSQAQASLAREGVEAVRLEVGVMVEVPALALAAERFAPEVDFFSVGTNDLTQYTMAAERGNAAVAELADGLAPPVLALIGAVVAAAERHGRWVGVCGELAGDPPAVPVLIGLGVSELSVAAGAVAAVKHAVRGVEWADARALAAAALEQESAAAVRALVRSRPTRPNQEP